MSLLVYWKQILGICFITCAFASGYYLRSLQDQVGIDKQVSLGITEANNKISTNNNIDLMYNTNITHIDEDDKKYKIEGSDDKNAHCVIPDKWVHTLHSSSY